MLSCGMMFGKARFTSVTAVDRKWEVPTQHDSRMVDIREVELDDRVLHLSQDFHNL